MASAQSFWFRGLSALRWALGFEPFWLEEIYFPQIEKAKEQSRFERNVACFNRHLPSTILHRSLVAFVPSPLTGGGKRAARVRASAGRGQP